METKNHPIEPIEKEHHLPNHRFQVPAVHLPWCNVYVLCRCLDRVFSTRGVFEPKGSQPSDLPDVDNVDFPKAQKT